MSRKGIVLTIVALVLMSAGVCLCLYNFMRPTHILVVNPPPPEPAEDSPREYVSVS